MEKYNLNPRFFKLVISCLSIAIFGSIALISVSGQSLSQPCSEKFDTVTPPALPAGWTAQLINPTGNANAVEWQTTNSKSNTTPNSVFAPGPNFVTDNMLYLPPINVRSTLSFQRANNLENGFDGMVLEISYDGRNFQDIMTAGIKFRQGGYDRTISNVSSNQSPIQGRPAWTGLSAGSTANPAFVTTTLDFPPALQRRPLMLRFRVGTDNAFSASGVNGAWIDSFSCGRPDVNYHELIYGMTAADGENGNADQNLVYFYSDTPNATTTVGKFTGLVAGHSLRSIDFRPTSNQLYAISTNGAAAAQLYIVDLATATLTPVGSGFTLGSNTSPIVEMEFNPVTELIRIVTADTGGSNNFLANPNDGTLISTDTALSGGTNTVIVGSAFSNNIIGASTTTLYAWNYQNDSLVTIGGQNGSPSPSSGQVFTVNAPSVVLTYNKSLGMDISGKTGYLYVTHQDSNLSYNLYVRDINSVTERYLGTYASNIPVADISVTRSLEPVAVNVSNSGKTVAENGKSRTSKREKSMTASNVESSSRK